MLKILLLVALSALSKPALPSSYGDIIADSIVSNYDGDTITVTINQWPPIIGDRLKVRAAGYDTPEIRGKCRREKFLAVQAKKLLSSILSNAERVELRNIKRGTFFRVVADVYIDGRPLSELMLKTKFARIYDGKSKRLSWCNYEKL